MAKLTLDVPDSMAEYWNATQLDTDTKTRSDAMMFYPLMRKEMLTHMQAARILGIEEDTLNTIYDDYELPHRVASYKDYAESTEKILDQIEREHQENARQAHVRQKRVQQACISTSNVLIYKQESHTLTMCPVTVLTGR